MANARIVLTGPINPSAVDLLAEVAPVEVAGSSDEETLMTLLDGMLTGCSVTYVWAGLQGCLW